MTTEPEEDDMTATDLLLIGGLVLLLLGRKRKASDVVEWDDAAGVFIVNGQRVSVETIRRQVLRVEKWFSQSMRSATLKFVDGTISANEWKRTMLSLIRSSHTIAAALAVGSTSAAATEPAVVKAIKTEQTYARAFVDSHSTKDAKEITKLKKRLVARASSYFLAVGVTNTLADLAKRRMTGSTECRRILRAKEHCQGCINWAYEWVPIAKMPPIGSLNCGSRCRCYLEYR